MNSETSEPGETFKSLHTNLSLTTYSIRGQASAL